ncbi:MAG: cell wall hydrolase [Aminipila sp.]
MYKYKCTTACERHTLPDGGSPCCRECKDKWDCEDVCDTADNEYCKYRTPKRLKKINWFSVFMFSICAFMLAQCILYGCTLHRLCRLEKMQTDTLNQLMEIRLTLDVHNEEKTSAEQFTETSIKLDAKTPQKILSDKDFEYITRVCMAEAGNIYEGNLAVAQVIHDRAVLWNMTPYEVVTKKGQFTQPRSGELYAESVQAVTDVFCNGVKAFEDEKATHFHGGSDKPYWTKCKIVVGTVGGNTFYR